MTYHAHVSKGSMKLSHNADRRDDFVLKSQPLPAITHPAYRPVVGGKHLNLAWLSKR
jgi:hypothetical protein